MLILRRYAEITVTLEAKNMELKQKLQFGTMEHSRAAEAALYAPAPAATTSPLSRPAVKRQLRGLFALIVTSAL